MDLDSDKAQVCQLLCEVENLTHWASVCPPVNGDHTAHYIMSHNKTEPNINDSQYNWFLPHPTSYSFPFFRDCSLNCVTQKTEETESHISMCVDTASQHPLADSRTPHATSRACDFAQQPVARERARSGQTRSFEGSCPASGSLQHSPRSPVTVELWSGYNGTGRPSFFFWT